MTLFNNVIFTNIYTNFTYECTRYRISLLYTFQGTDIKKGHM